MKRITFQQFKVRGFSRRRPTIRPTYKVQPELLPSFAQEKVMDGATMLLVYDSQEIIDSSTYQHIDYRPINILPDLFSGTQLYVKAYTALVLA